MNIFTESMKFFLENMDFTKKLTRIFPVDIVLPSGVQEFWRLLKSCELIPAWATSINFCLNREPASIIGAAIVPCLRNVEYSRIPVKEMPSWYYS